MDSDPSTDRTVLDPSAAAAGRRAYRVLMVCTGNICRSPMAQVVLTERLQRAGLQDEVEVGSAGVSDEEAGNPIDPRARTVLREAGYPVPEEHQAHQVAPGELGGYDLVLAMTHQHAQALRRRAEQDGLAVTSPDAATQVRLFREFDPTAPRLSGGTSPQELDVPDPWYGDQDGFYRTLDAVEAAADGLLEHCKETLANR
ncbi:low molecular weight phosphotyrosine protein phosphatase [Georgenia sp. 10Sc9-8]|uniref:protein-tyrosine-phosphatase n=1 Tax=Georgenia halotolerans TaxID=3028317 RepID=A0ABT5TYN0_9MICO|nr:low molecular weight phosphotyrosine protein phosphatase [Georgenia halotolerans]